MKVFSQSDLSSAPSPVLSSEHVTVFGPASLSNLGPGFDALGLCLEGPGDRIEAWLVEESGVHIVLPEEEGTAATPIPTDPACNTASVAAASVLDQAGTRHGVALRIEKGIPLGSGIGGSAASAVAGAWAANQCLGAPLGTGALVEAALAGEAIASGSRHGDNVLPALLGGLVLVSPTRPTYYRRIEVPAALPIALLLPEVAILTRAAREDLPDRVPRRDAVHNAAELAFLVDAFRCGDIETAARHMMSDRLTEPVRARHVPCYEAVRQAALDAGGWGCALTGSGPAMYAIAETTRRAEKVLEAMLEASRSAGVAASGFVTQASPRGVHCLSKQRG